MIYTLYLDSENGTRIELPNQFINSRQVYYLVDWDDLFKGKNKEYKRCRVKANMEQPCPYVNANATTNGVFFVSATFGNTTQSSSTQNTSGIRGTTLLGFLKTEETGITFNNITQPSNVRLNTLNTDGVSITTPQGQSNLYIYIDFAYPPLTGYLNNSDFNQTTFYKCVLTFEFEEDEDEDD